MWIDFLRGRDLAHVRTLVSLVRNDAGIAVTDVVLTEVLQGVRDEQAARKVEAQLLEFEVLHLEAPDDFVRAAALYRQARGRGHTIRKTIDCLIAAVCLRHDVALLHNDADFDRLAVATPLVVHSTT